jgi:MYXO-CTERM domain-containing protein
MVTGLGSVDAHNLVAAWTGLTPTRTVLQPPSGTTEGAPVQLVATVASNATANAMTGSVLFYLETTDDAGTPDLSLAATAALTPTTAGSEGGTATANVIAPPGLFGKARVVAFYAGDSHYLASWSPAASVASTSTFAASPRAISLPPNAQRTFTSSGGTPPVVWTIVRDSTCNANNVCAQVESLTATDGAFQAGAVAGTTVVAAIDADGAEARIEVNVFGLPVDGGTLPPAWDGGDGDGGAPETDAGDDAPSGDDSGAHDASGPPSAGGGGAADVSVVAADASYPVTAGGSADSGASEGAQSPAAGGGGDAGSGGCSCTTVGSTSAGGANGAFGALVFAMAAGGRLTSWRSRNRASCRRRSTT